MSEINIHYSNERNVQILIALLKEHGIKNIIISPGSTNICFAASVQSDNYFNVYSCVDERSAAYMACGMAAETQEPVVINCTGATASRNYMPGLTEAYYRQLPILAVTSCQPRERIGQYIPQVLDRSCVPNDIVKKSVYIETIYNEEKEWSAVTRINSTLIELHRNGGGPVHIDLETNYSPDFGIEILPKVRIINDYNGDSELPILTGKRIAIFVGSHMKWSDELTNSVSSFCEKYKAVVLCDQTSNYWGKNRIQPNILCSQRNYRADCLKMDVLIHIGQMSGAYMQLYPTEVWRVSPDGEIRDTFRKITKIFSMDENLFFKKYLEMPNKSDNEDYYDLWKQELNETYRLIDNLPFSNVWISQQSAKRVPKNSAVHFGILNSLRSWNFFESTEGILGYCNTGGFGIDGGVSTLIGASIVNPKKLFFGIVGDLAFFYDVNSMGNRHIGKNVRILLINNGKGNEFRNYGNWGAPLGEFADKFICAAGHYGDKSKKIVKNIAENLGFKYLTASNKDEYLEAAKEFWDGGDLNCPLLFEVFTETNDESYALEILYNLRKSAGSTAKGVVKSLLGEKGFNMLKKAIKNKSMERD